MVTPNNQKQQFITLAAENKSGEIFIFIHGEKNSTMRLPVSDIQLAEWVYNIMMARKTPDIKIRIRPSDGSGEKLIMFSMFSTE